MIMVSNQTGIEGGLLAGKYPGRIGHLYSPWGQRGPWPEIPYALDNGAWGAFKNHRPWDEPAWRNLLTWAAMSGVRPLWAVVPDVVGDRDGTLAAWDKYAPTVRACGFRPAFALQDGMTFGDVPDADCMLFVGGGTAWKVAAIPAWCPAFPGRVHVARVTTWRRLVASWRAGAVSVDGTGFFHRVGSQASDLRKFLRETTK